MGARVVKRATSAEVAAWKKRNKHSNATGAAVFGVHPRTFARWATGVSKSPKLAGDRFRTEGRK